MRRYKFYNKHTGETLESSHNSSYLTEREFGIPYGSLKQLGQVKTNTLNNDSLTFLQFNPNIPDTSLLRG